MKVREAWLALGVMALVGCSAGPAPTVQGTPSVGSTTIESSLPGQAATASEAVEQMVTTACEVGFYNFTTLNAPLSSCATFIFAVDAKGGVDPRAFQEAMARGDSEGATREVVAAWDNLWSSWLAGATLVCDQTADGPQDATELEITLAALEAASPRRSRQIYAQSQGVFCPSISLPTDGQSSQALSVQEATAALCREPVSALPDLIDAGDSPYWTEVIQVISTSQGISVGPIDGEYGPQTIAGVRQLQRLIGVVDDGQIGPISWSALQVYLC